MSLVTTLEDAALAAVKTAAVNLPTPYGVTAQALIAAVEAPTTANILAAISAVVAAVEAAEAAGVSKALASGAVIQPVGGPTQ